MLISGDAPWKGCIIMATKTKRKQARKYLPGIAAWVRQLKKAGQKPTIVQIAKHFGFNDLKSFCLWLAGTVSRLESSTKLDGKPNEMHGTADHVFAKALLASLKAKYEGDHPDYFAVQSTGNPNAGIMKVIGSEEKFDPNDENATANWLDSAVDFADEEIENDENDKNDEEETASK